MWQDPAKTGKNLVIVHFQEKTLQYILDAQIWKSWLY